MKKGLGGRDMGGTGEDVRGWDEGVGRVWEGVREPLHSPLPIFSSLTKKEIDINTLYKSKRYLAPVRYCSTKDPKSQV